LAAQRVDRRLAAILAADIAGYSRLMCADKEGTLARLETHRRELIEPKIAEHKGRMLGLRPRAKTTGTCMLAAFLSVVDAVRCAVAAQRAMDDRNAALPEDQRMSFRIGVSLGDIRLGSRPDHRPALALFVIGRDTVPRRPTVFLPLLAENDGIIGLAQSMRGRNDGL